MQQERKESMHAQQRKMIRLFTDIMSDRQSLTAIKGLSLFKLEHSFSRCPLSYNSEIIILAQGEKKVYFGNDIYTYDVSRYLVLPVPLPIACEGKTEKGKPILGLSIAIDPVEVGGILRDMHYDKKEISILPKGIYSASMTAVLYDAVIRILQAIIVPQDRTVLAPLIKREIIYRVLQGENGEILQALVQHKRRFFQIAKVLQKIHESYSSTFDIEKLAQELDMSSSTFHSSFKAVTETSPLQYIKDLRLHKARTMMIQDGLNASVAAIKVGYESPSQFNREYKRLFGITPAKDAAVVPG